MTFNSKFKMNLILKNKNINLNLIINNSKIFLQIKSYMMIVRRFKIFQQLMKTKKYLKNK